MHLMGLSVALTSLIYGLTLKSLGGRGGGGGGGGRKCPRPLQLHAAFKRLVLLTSYSMTLSKIYFSNYQYNFQIV